MKKIVLFFSIFCILSIYSSAQEKLQFGLSTEGSWFMPAETFSYYRDLKKDGFGAGIGVYASRDIFWRISADVGLLYRYTEMKQYYQTIDTAGGDYLNELGYPTSSIEGWDKLTMHSLVVPIHWRLHFTKSLFFSGGI